MILAGLACLVYSLRQPVTLIIDGQRQIVQTSAFTTAGVLRDAGLALAPGDTIQPAGNARFWQAPVISITRARPVTLLTASGDQVLTSTALRASDLLAETGHKLFPGDLLLVDGTTAEAGTLLTPGESHLVQLRQAVPVEVSDAGQSITIYSAAPTLGEALWDADIRLAPADLLNPPASTPLDGPLSAAITRAKLVQIEAYGHQVAISTAASTVGEALAAAGVSLQGLDYSQPEESAPIPAERTIRVVRASQQVVFNLEELPFKTSYELDPETELDQESVITPGITGLVATRERILFEDGQEVGRITDGTWTARGVQDAVTGQGMKVVVRKIEGTDYEYWRKITVYATSYSPCRVGGGRCSDHTAIGLPVQKGVAAVTLRWFRDMRLQKIYVPGYGTAVIGDTGGGIPGRYWIDLAFSDDDYVSWHQWVTIYFLTPVPQYIPYILYP